MDATAQHLMAQLRQNPLDPGLLEALRSHCENVADPTTWAEALEHHARTAHLANADPVELGRLHYELGNLYRDQLGRSDRAISHYRQAIDFDAAQRPAIAAARAIFAEAGKWDQVAKLLAREAESLPDGAKRAALLKEQATVLRQRLGDEAGAADALREAVGVAPEDLGLQHELATLLLDRADAESDRSRSGAYRLEAADILHGMAQKVSDDYAFAYVEAALDAVPDHEPSLRLLQSIAPRLGRADSIPARWVACLQHTPEGPLARELRLKLAIAYRTAGQKEDAIVCLQPLLDDGDAEARALFAELSPAPSRAPAAKRSSAPRKSEKPSQRVSTPSQARPSAPAAASSRSLFDLEEIHAEPTNPAKDLSRALSELRDSSESDASAPLSDLASLLGSERTGGRTTVEESPIGEAEEDPIADDEATHDEHDVEELTVSGVEELRRLIAEDIQAQLGAPVTERPASEEMREPEAVISPAPEPVHEVSSELAEELTSGAFELEEEDDDEEEHAEQPVDSLGAGDETPAGGAELPDETTKPRGDGSSRASRAPLAAAQKATTARPSRPLPDEIPPERPTLEDISEEPEDELTMLRRELRKRLRFRDRRGAAELAERLLSMGHLEPDAIAALEDQYRMTRDFRRMRDLAMRIAGELEVPVEQRLARLREAAMLSESKLGDVEGTALAWREVLALVPVDDEANNKLRRLLTRLSRWEELAELLIQRAEVDPEPLDRANRYREIATLQRDRRKAVGDAITALERARALDPDHAADVVALCDLYVTANRPADAAISYEWRVAHVEEPVEKVPLLATLGDLYENELADLEAAYRSAEALLQVAPRHLASLDRMLRIDERLQRWDNVVRVLEAKLLHADAGGRAKLHAQIGAISLHSLKEPARAADAYASALDIVPDDRGLLTSAAEAFELAGRREELTESIGAAAQHARDATKRFDLFQMVAERREVDGDISAAIAAREAQLAVRREPAVLGLLVALLRKTDRAGDLVRRLDELARTEQPRAARELRLERAALLAEQLSNLEAAKGELVRVLEELSPNDTQVLEMLIDLCRRTDDVARRTEAQERLIKLTTSLESKVDLVTDLVETFEKEGDSEGAIRVLRNWIGFEPDNPQPHLRIAPLLAQAGQREELLAAYDALARLAMDEDEVGEYVLRGARVALELGDHESAWKRLVPRVVDAGDDDAEQLLKEVAEKGGRAEALAEVYIGLAQRDEGGPDGPRRWLDAARTYETLAGSHEKALEAVLRAFAKNLDDGALLAEADRLAGLAHAWARLSQVYDALVRRAETPAARIEILMRHAKLLEEHALDAQAAAARASLAFQVDPAQEEPFREAVRLATKLTASESLLALYERRALANVPTEARLSALLEACSTAQTELGDTPRATGYLARAVLLGQADEALLDRIEACAKQLDADDPSPHGQGLVYALSEVYAREAREGGHGNALAALLWTRVALIRDHVLGDLPGAYAALEQASSHRIADESLLDALLDLAHRAERLDAVAEHLAQRAERAIDSSTASAALARLGTLYEGSLASHDLAAETYAQLVKLNPRDPSAFSRLRGALKAGDKHKELLSAIERQLALSPDPGTRLDLLKETAEVWERDLQNRFEALDAWRKVSALAPDDKAAADAIQRLRARPLLDDLALLDGDLVVRPEDLRPSLPPEPVAAPEPVPPVAIVHEQAQPIPDGATPHGGWRADDAGPVEESDAEQGHAIDHDSRSEMAQAAADSEEPDAPRFDHAEEREADLRDSVEALGSAREHSVEARGSAREHSVEALGSARESSVDALDEQAPVAAADMLASLADEVPALQDHDRADDEQVSELERAAFDASHAPPEAGLDQVEEQIAQQRDEIGEISVDVALSERPEESASGELGSTPDADENDEDPVEARGSAPPLAHAQDEGELAEQPALAEADGADDTPPDGRAESDARAEDETMELDAHLEEDPSGDLDSLSSLVSGGGGAGRARGASRIPPPPPARRGASTPPAKTRTTPPEPPKNGRPPPPPRRD